MKQKSLAILIEMHAMKDEIGLVSLSPDVAARVKDELGWIAGLDFWNRLEPPTRDMMRVQSKGGR